MSGCYTANSKANRNVPSYPMMDTQPLPITDYPAAHSMDTEWYAVDEKGEIGGFSTDSEGVVPALENMTPPNGEAWSQVRTAISWDGYYAPCRQQHHRSPREMVEAVGEYAPDDRIHHFMPPGAGYGYYYWRSSPEKPLRIEDLPEAMRGGDHLIFLKDYVFASHEPINPLDHAPGGFAQGGESTFPFPDADQTLFPLPNGRQHWDLDNYIWSFEVCCSYSREDKSKHINPGKVWFGIDDDDCLAVFRTDRFGAIPKAVADREFDAARFERLIERLLSRSPFLEELGPGMSPEELFDRLQMKIKTPNLALLFVDPEWAKRSLHTVIQAPGGGLAFCLSRYSKTIYEWTQQESAVIQGWVDGWARHWLEYPFGPAPPRLWGCYHYDASWHHPIPYCRVGEPRKPLKLEQVAGEWLEAMTPVRLAGVRFAHAPLVQPFEHVECQSVSDSYQDYNGKYTRAEIWIDAALERVHLIDPSSIKRDDDERVLRRARRYVAMVNELWRKG